LKIFDELVGTPAYYGLGLAWLANTNQSGGFRAAQNIELLKIMQNI
jgi:hypothetical protein